MAAEKNLFFIQVRTLVHKTYFPPKITLGPICSSCSWQQQLLFNGSLYDTSSCLGTVNRTDYNRQYFHKKKRGRHLKRKENDSVITCLSTMGPQSRNPVNDSNNSV